MRPAAMVLGASDTGFSGTGGSFRSSGQTTGPRPHAVWANNAAERSLRHAVISRKLSFGTQSARGSRFVETLLSVIETCRQQRRNVFDHVTRSVQAHFHREPAPSLLPRA